jgi:hypothetical protein
MSKGPQKGAQAWETVGVKRETWNGMRRRNEEAAWTRYTEALIAQGAAPDEATERTQAARIATEAKSAAAKAALAAHTEQLQ